MAEVLEHEILKCLYRFSMFTAANGSQKRGYVPIYERGYEHCTLHFGTLVGMLNNPEDYTLDKAPEGHLMYFQELVRKIDEIKLTKFTFQQVADALEILLLNEHIKETYPIVYSDVNSRQLILLKKGAIDFRKEFYLKQSEAAEIDTIKNTTARIEHSLKTHWLRNEVIKYTVTTVVGAILGAVIALLSLQSGQKSPKKLDKQLMITADTIILK